MGYNKENFKRIREAYATKHLIAEAAAKVREIEIHALLPEVAAIDRELAETGVALMGASLMSAPAREKKLEELRRRNGELNEKRNRLLFDAGYPASYTDVKYECKQCADSGYVGTRMCECMRRDLILAGYESSGIAHLLRTQTFDSFSPDYYKEDEKAYRNIEYVLGVVKEYAEQFEPSKAQNLAFFGGTGLGKTHLSSAIARTVIDRGFDVLYVSAIELVSSFEAEQFGKGVLHGEITDKFFDCDLLIIDDLGTEMSNTFTQSTLYNVLNIRINKKAPTIISTNCDQKELMKKYNERIASRIFGEFRPLLFLGADIRMQKIKS